MCMCVFMRLQIRCSWYKLCIAAKDNSIYAHVVDMLSTQGRMKVRLALLGCLHGKAAANSLAGLITTASPASLLAAVTRRLDEHDAAVVNCCLAEVKPSVANTALVSHTLGLLPRLLPMSSTSNWSLLHAIVSGNGPPLTFLS